MGILIENYAGAFPLWLAPVQVVLIAVTDAVMPYVNDVAEEMRAYGLRVETIGGMPIGKSIRNAEKSKVPVMCIVGEREAESRTLSVRTYQDGEQGSMMVDLVRDKLCLAAQNRSLIDFST